MSEICSKFIYFLVSDFLPISCQAPENTFLGISLHNVFSFGPIFKIKNSLTNPQDVTFRPVLDRKCVDQRCFTVEVLIHKLPLIIIIAP